MQRFVQRLRSSLPLFVRQSPQQANILNIGTEGIMLVGAFTAVAVSYFTGSWLLGIIAAMIAGAVIAMIMAVGHIRYNSGDLCDRYGY